MTPWWLSVIFIILAAVLGWYGSRLNLKAQMKRDSDVRRQGRIEQSYSDLQTSAHALMKWAAAQTGSILNFRPGDRYPHDRPPDLPMPEIFWSPDVRRLRNLLDQYGTHLAARSAMYVQYGPAMPDDDADSIANRMGADQNRYFDLMQGTYRDLVLTIQKELDVPSDGTVDESYHVY